MSALPARLVARAAHRPWLTLGLGLVLTLAALWIVAARMAMTTDTSELISPTVDWRIEERRHDAAFPQLRDALLVVIDGNTPERAEAAAAALADRLATDTAHFRRVTRPDGGEFFAREGLLYGSLDEVRGATKSMIEAQPLLGPLAADPSLRGIAGAVGTMLDGVDAGETTLARIDKPMTAMAGAIDARLAGRDPAFSWQSLFAGEGAPAPPLRRLVLVQPVLDHAALEAGAPAGAAIQAAARALALDPAHGVTVRLTGEVPLADEEFATLQDNIGLVAAVMFGAMLLTLWLATRSVKLVTAILGTIVAGLVITTALGLLAIGRLNLISIAFIPLFVGLGVDFGIQLAVRFNHERLGGDEPAAALANAARALGAPLTLAAAAIVLGFLAFLPTAYVGIAELGVIAGMGMVVALGFSLTVLPAAIVLLRPGVPQREVGIAAFAPADRWLATHRRAVLWAFGVALAASIAALPWVGFDFNPLHLRDPNAPAMRTLSDLTRDPDRSPATIDVLAKSPAEARALAEKLSRLPEVRQVVTLDSFVPADQPPKLALVQDASLLLDLTLNPFDLPTTPSDGERVAALQATAARLHNATGAPAQALAKSFDRLVAASPQQRSAVEAMLIQPLSVMLEQMRRSLGAQGVTRETLPADLVRDWEAPGGLARVQVFPRGDVTDNAALVRFRDAVLKVAPSASGLPVATQAAARTVAGAFVQAGIIAFVLVSVLLLAVLRNAREVLFTLAPVVLSIFLTLGTCVVIGQPVNFANIIAFPLLFGVGVAFHIYFVMAWRAGARDLLQSSLARAVLFSAFATGTAFGSLWLSHHPGTASMGKILMISLVWTLVCALVFEPALLGPPRDEKPRPA